MVKKIKLPDSGGLEAAAANFGAQRAAEISVEKSKIYFLTISNAI